MLISEVLCRDLAWVVLSFTVTALLNHLRIVTSLNFEALSLGVTSALAFLSFVVRIRAILTLSIAITTTATSVVAVVVIFLVKLSH